MGSVVRQKRIAIIDGKLTEKHQRWMKILGKRMNHASFCHPINRPTQTFSNIVVVICLYSTAVGQYGRSLYFGHSLVNLVVCILNWWVSLYHTLLFLVIIYMPLFFKKKSSVAVLSTSKSTLCTPLKDVPYALP